MKVLDKKLIIVALIIGFTGLAIAGPNIDKVVPDDEVILKGEETDISVEASHDDKILYIIGNYSGAKHKKICDTLFYCDKEFTFSEDSPGEYELKFWARGSNYDKSETVTEDIVVNEKPKIQSFQITDNPTVGNEAEATVRATDNEAINRLVFNLDGERETLKCDTNDVCERTYKFTPEETGSHTLEVKARDNYHQQSDTQTKTFNVQEGDLTADFTWDPSHPEAEEEVSFSPSISHDNELERAVWSFGDGSSNVIKTDNVEGDVNHTFQQEGTYTVTLTVEDVNGEEVSKDYVVEVDEEDSDLDASFSWDPTRPEEGEGVTFTPNIDNDADLDSVKWSFGDGSSPVNNIDDSDVDHKYTEDGSYTVSLEVIDEDDNQVTVEEEIQVVDDRSCEIEHQGFNVDPQTVPRGNNVDISLNVLNHGKKNQTVKVDFVSSEGNYEKRKTVENQSARSFNTTWSIDHSTEVYAEYSVIGECDASGQTETKQIEVIDGPSADFSVSDPKVEIGETVTFRAHQTDNVKSYDWEVDGEDGGGETTHATFTSTGTKTITLQVTNNQDQTNEATKQVEVVRNDLEASISVSNDRPEVGESVSFSSNSEGDITDRSWDLDNDGSFDDGSGGDTSYTYDTTGTKTVSLKIQDRYGNQDTAQETVNIQEVRPTADFSVSNRNPDTGEVVEFEAETSDNFERSELDYSWSFGDGSSGSGMNPTNVYTNSGFKDVELTVTGPSGNTATATQTLAVSPEGDFYPDAEINYSPENPAVDDTVTFSGSSSTSPQGEIQSYEWNLGDGSNTTEGEVVTHDYNNPGAYYSRLKITDNNGNADYAVKPVNVAGFGNTCNVDVSNLNIDPHFEQPGEADISLDVESEDSGDLEVDVRFYKADQQIHSDHRVIEDDDQLEFETSVKTDEDVELRAEVDVEGDCGTVSFERSQLFDVNEDKIEHPGHGLEIIEVNHPESVCKGDPFSANVKVRNGRDSDETSAIEGRGLGSIFRTPSFDINSGEKRTQSVTFTNVQGSGERSFTVSVDNGESVTRNIELNDCGMNGDDSGILSMEVSPQTIVVGNSIRVSGYLEKNGRRNVNVMLDGNEVTTVNSRSDGYYEAHIQPQKVGMVQISVSTGSDLKSKTVNILPTVSLAHLDAPRQVQAGDSFEICGNVESQVSPRITMKRDGERIDSQKKSGEFCFENIENQPGTYKYKIDAAALGAFDSQTAKVEVLKAGSEVTQFPDQIASVESDSGMVKIELYNTHDEKRTYDLRLNDLPDGWTSQSKKQVVLPANQRETVYFYLTPRDTGQFTAELEVDSDGETIHSEDLRLSSRNEKPASRSFFSRLMQMISI